MGSIGANGGGIVGASVLGANGSGCGGGPIFPGKGPVSVGVDLGVGAPGVSASGPGGDVGFFDVFFVVPGSGDETHGLFGCCLDGGGGLAAG